jgi:uncharacterized membrane protein YfcA
MWVEVVLLGLAAGVLVGLMGIGGGVVLVPAMVYLLGMDQHVSQGTSLLLQLPPVGIGALYLYWRKGRVDLPAGLVCATGLLLGGYFGSLAAVQMSSNRLRGLFGVFQMVAAVLLWWRSRQENNARRANG